MRKYVFLALALCAAVSVAGADLAAGQRAYDAGDYATALKEFEPLAEQGDVRAQLFLGEMYYSGKGVPQNPIKAVSCYRGWEWPRSAATDKDLEWLRAAAEQGDRNAQRALALRSPEPVAIPLFRLAAEKGDPLAQAELGVSYLYGNGVPQDDKEAFKWLRSAAEQGDMLGESGLGGMYLDATGVALNYKEAEKWLRLAADRGEPVAQFRLWHLVLRRARTRQGPRAG